ncbi:MAG TPA: aminodeoxychorismate synthase component I [Stenomitos sp.]
MSSPYVRPLDLDPDQVRAFAASQPYGFVLDSGQSPEGWQFVGWRPRWTLTCRGELRILCRDGELETSRGPALESLRTVLAAWRLDPEGVTPPFWGGGVGFLSYDLGWQLERLPRRIEDDLGTPELSWAFYDAVVAIPTIGTPLLCITPAPGERLEDMDAKRAAWERELRSLPTPEPVPAGRAAGTPRATFSRDAYMRSVETILDHIAAGDLYQANLSQRFAIPFEGDAFGWFEALRAHNPAPFAAFLNWPDMTVVSSSPERFIRLHAGRVETAPIKGTRPRGKTPAEDQALAHTLATSLKDRAEHLMIVDLERNDLGRVCRIGSVHVPERFVLEAHPTVWHLVSTVAGQLPPERDEVDLLAATFPGGSITGAPKLRSMEILEGLEPTRRGLYTGSIGYLGRAGQLDLNIAIRTAILKDGTAYLQVGGGIVADSDPAAEYQETLDKARAFFRTLGVETACELS